MTVAGGDVSSGNDPVDEPIERVALAGKPSCDRLGQAGAPIH